MDPRFREDDVGESIGSLCFHELGNLLLAMVVCVKKPYGKGTAMPARRTDEKKGYSPKRATFDFLTYSVGWLMGLEPTTTGITILDSTN